MSARTTSTQSAEGTTKSGASVEFPAALEYNFDGLVGPTHNFAGLSAGNLASASHAQRVSYPKQAALEGLAKMRTMVRLGLPQAVLPPHERPNVPAIRQLGFTGSLSSAVAHLQGADPRLLATLSSASAMWAANAATVSPSADTADRRVHFTPANLVSTLHRSFEGPFTTTVLRTIFGDADHFVVHDPLPSHALFADEGAANHGRFAPSHGAAGLELFVFGRDDAPGSGDVSPMRRFPRRQTRLACETIVRSHLLDPVKVQVVQQSGRAIDAGAFHNDVVSVTNQNVFFTHEQAFDDGPKLFNLLTDSGIDVICVPSDAVSLGDAVSSYLFNSQLVTLPNGQMSLIAPAEARENPAVSAYLEELVGSGSVIRSVEYVDVRQSMSNGGGPACLRLRVVLTESEARSLGASVVVDEAKLSELEGWVTANYREELRPKDLADPALLEETQGALDGLTQILELGPIYDFQHARPGRRELSK